MPANLIPPSFRVIALIFTLFTVCVTLSGNARAHAVVTESSLTKTAIKPQTKTTVVLFFNANVELSLSKIFLVSKGDVYQPAHAEKGTKPGEIRIHIPPLQPGDYALKYKVFAADGHLTESVIRFNVGGN